MDLLDLIPAAAPTSPSAQLARLLAGGQPWEAAPAAIRSWAALPIHRMALAVLAERDQPARQAALAKMPETIRPHVEAEARRLWNVARKPHFVLDGAD
jgi:hypothetical protein